MGLKDSAYATLAHKRQWHYLMNYIINNTEMVFELKG